MLEFLNRVRKNLKTRQKWAQKTGLEVYRIYDRDMPQYPFVIDKLGKWIIVGSFAKYPEVFQELLTQKVELAEALQVTEGSLVMRQRMKQKGLSQYDKLAQERVTDLILENDLNYEINVTDYLDVGLFLDHRKTRAHLKLWGFEKECLNLFAYTGSISVALAAAGAKRVDTVDMSQTYLSWSKRNFDLNGMSEVQCPQYRFVQADVTAWLREERSGAFNHYDFIFVDPPSFSNSKRMNGTFDVSRDHGWLLEQCAQRLSPKGLIFFSNNKKGFELEQNVLPQFLRAEITNLTHSKDFSARVAHKSFIFGEDKVTFEGYMKGLRRLGPEY